MKNGMLVALLLHSAFAVAQGTSSEDVLASLGIKLQDAMKQLQALDDSDQAIARSNQVQIDTSQMLDRAERKIRQEEHPRLIERAREADEMKTRLLRSGCPEHGGEVAREVADRCNPQIRAHRAVVERIEADGLELRARFDKIEHTRGEVSKTTLRNAQQQKENNNRRDELQAAKQRIYLEMIRVSIANADRRRKATEACNRREKPEEVHCCHSVINDGANPSRCGVELIYQVFKGGDVFSAPVVRPAR